MAYITGHKKKLRSGAAEWVYECVCVVGVICVRLLIYCRRWKPGMQKDGGEPADGRTDSRRDKCLMINLFCHLHNRHTAFAPC